MRQNMGNRAGAMRGLDRAGAMSGREMPATGGSRADAMRGLDRAGAMSGREMPGMKKGGKVKTHSKAKHYAKGGGCEVRGKTKGKMR